VHHEPEWLRDAVTRLTDEHEGRRAEPWHVDDAPDEFIDAQLRGIVGVELTVTAVEGKAKWSQNRSAADRERVVAGLRADGRPGDLGVADAMAASLDVVSDA
jgi:transcriptional regulator